MFHKELGPDRIQEWTCVWQTGVESEAGLVQAFLQNRGFDSRILSKKDSAYTVNFGDLSAIFIYVPDTEAEEAKKAIEEWEKGEIVGLPGEDGHDEENGDVKEADDDSAWKADGTDEESTR